MKKFAAALFVTFCFAPLLFGQKTRLGSLPKAKPGVEYPLKVHISAVSVRKECPARLNGQPCNELDVNAIIDGNKIGLRGAEVSYPTYTRFNVLPGDYEARLLKVSPKGDGAELFREYELLLAGKVIWQCTVTSISE